MDWAIGAIVVLVIVGLLYPMFIHSGTLSRIEEREEQERAHKNRER